MLRATSDSTHARLSAWLLMIASLAACSPDTTDLGATAPGPDANEPVSYDGWIPCADCPGQRLTLTLFPDSTFRLRQTFLGVPEGQAADVYDLGRWVRAQDDGDRLSLFGTTETPRLFRFVNSDTVRVLDMEGNEITSHLNYDLTRQGVVDAVAGPMPLKGMYTYMADAASLEECFTGNRYPVLIEAEHLAVEQGYLAARSGPGEALLLSIDGRFVSRAPEPGIPTREHILVTRLDRFMPGETCAGE